MKSAEIATPQLHPVRVEMFLLPCINLLRQQRALFFLLALAVDSGAGGRFALEFFLPTTNTDGICHTVLCCCPAPRASVDV